jgi:hypothetical protein
MKTTEIKTFQTHDLYLASALKISGFKFITLKNVDGKGVFTFQDREDRSQFVMDYYSGKLTGSLKEFSSAWAGLKSLVNEMGRKSD